MDYSSRNIAIILYVLESGASVKDAASVFHVSDRWVRKLLARYRSGGLNAVKTRSTRPHTMPSKTSDSMVDLICSTRVWLHEQGWDNGAHTIRDWLVRRYPDETIPSVATIWRIVKKAGLVQPQPVKRPRCSYRRFQADLPNELWQSDFTHIHLRDGKECEVIGWIDDHSRCIMYLRAFERITGRIVVDSFTQAISIYGVPQATLTDNGCVYTARFSGGRHVYQPNAFEMLLTDLHVQQRNGLPYHPTTQGKIERLWQTLKQWVYARGIPSSIDQLNTWLDEFTHVYNRERSHRALHGMTPWSVYTNTHKASARIDIDHVSYRVRYDRVDAYGRVTLRYKGRILHLGLSKKRKNCPVILLIHGNHVIALDRQIHQIIGYFELDETKNYQKLLPATTITDKNGTMS